MVTLKKSQIATLAETIRESLELSSPVDVAAAVRRLGGKLIETERLEADMEAKVRRQNDEFEIVIQRNKPATRKRFSIAHELGHLFLHMGFLVNPDLWNESGEYCDSVYYRYGYGVEEEEANEFAAAFLMPEAEFRTISQRHVVNGFCSIPQISKYFGASQDATMIRGRNLGLFRVL